MKILLLPFSLLFGPLLWGQYYYNDIVGTQETNQQMQTWLANKVKTVSATGFDGNNVRNNDFSEYYEVRENGRAMKVSSIINMNKTVIYSRFDEQSRVIYMTDSFAIIQNSTTYEYDSKGRVSRVQNTVKDSANDFNQVETHSWIYSPEGKPVIMWRVVTNTGSENSIDSLEVRFVPDEDGNVGEERSYKKNVETGYLYYYYDDQNRLSDIVRYHKKLEKLIPDIMFEHDPQGRVIQKITTTSDRVVGYLIWRYIYDEKGLKTKEALFNNDKKLTGKIEYAYTFGQ
jgi:antitoxin component YwqK of YwqJK toxin-antitoxin module